MVRRRSLSDEDKMLWTHVTKDIEPLKRRKRTRKPVNIAVDAAVPPPPPPGKMVKKTNIKSLAKPSVVKPITTPTPAPPPLEPMLTPPNRQWARQLKRGDLEVDARIDLHGRTELAAHSALLRFIEDAAARGDRSLLVITGKGRDGKGVLRARLPDWLSSGALGRQVMAIHPAHVKDGGGGAYYVILRKDRGRR